MSAVKTWERRAKRALLRVAPRLLPRRSGAAPDLRRADRILVFRLDQRIGNGLLALPLLRAVRASKPGAELHFFIHHPIATLFKAAVEGCPSLAPKFIFVTGGSGVPEHQRFFETYQPHLLHKPIGLDVLRGLVERVVKASIEARLSDSAAQSLARSTGAPASERAQR